VSAHRSQMDFRSCGCGWLCAAELPVLCPL
jgi:hypothetical protein